MRTIEFKDPHRKKHFEFFRSMNHPHFNLSAPVDVTDLLGFARAAGLPVTPCIAWTLSRAANRIPAFRQRLRGEQVIEHDLVHPSMAVTVADSEVFSFCEVTFSWEAEDFVPRARAAMDERRLSPSLEDKPGRDDYLFFSTLPWVAFTSIQHAMHYHPHDSIPRITWGRFMEQGGRTSMPLAVQVHHALVDGQHVGRFYAEVEQSVAQASSLLARVAM